jgi:hypothetical protein
MAYRVLAEIVLLVHFLWIVFLFVGGCWGRRSLITGSLHIGGLAFAVVIQVFGWYCPLTHLEVWLRRRQYPGAGFEGSFIVHYLERLVYPDVSMRLVFILTICLCVLNVLLYGASFMLKRHKRQ